MKINDEKLSHLFGVQPITDAEVINDLPMQSSEDSIDEEYNDELEFDIAVARRNILSAIENATEVLESAGKVAMDTEHPKVYESYSALLKSVTDASTALMNIHVQKKAIKKPDKKEESTTGTVNNTAVFVGTPAELCRMLKQGKE